MSSSISSSSGKFLIYFDAGTNKQSADALLELLANRFPFRIIEYANSEYLRTKSWEERTTLLVLPGGNPDACTTWQRNLGELGMKKIQDYVRKSKGRILGVCAGSYFISKASYHEGTDEELKTREFPLYQGEARGPLKPHSTTLLPPPSPPGVARVVRLFNPSSKSEGGCYYQEGPAFKKFSDVFSETLAEYAAPYDGVAVASFDGGVVCGPHLEFNSLRSSRLSRGSPGMSEELIDSLGRIAEELAEAECFRRELLDQIFEELGLSDSGQSPSGLDEWYDDDGNLIGDVDTPHEDTATVVKEYTLSSASKTYQSW